MVSCSGASAGVGEDGPALDTLVARGEFGKWVSSGWGGDELLVALAPPL